MKSLSRRIYSSSFIFSLGVAFAAYTNSSFLEKFVSSDYIGLVYSVSAILLFLALPRIPILISRIGNRHTALLILALNAFCILAMILSKDSAVAVPSFIFYLVLNSATFFTLDIFVERFSKQGSIGRTRGLFLTLNNIAWVCSPFLAGFLLLNFGFSALYSVSLATVTVVFILISGVTNFEDVKYDRTSFFKALGIAWRRKDIFFIVAIGFMLQFFYAWMVIYMPIHLRENIGFDFKTIGLIFTAMLLPFVLLEYPLGKMADRGLSEKKIIYAGFLIAGATTLLVSFIYSKSPIFYALALFATRIGASSIEVMSEVYFFKRIKESDTELLSLFRDMYPMAYLVGPFLATIILGLTNNISSLFMMLGLIFIFFGTWLSRRLLSTNVS